jgi:phenylpyruvate tautomerase PptA (4-oxalocrotonate tautomerase family)
MPYVNIQITQGATRAQKSQLAKIAQRAKKVSLAKKSLSYAVL